MRINISVIAILLISFSFLNTFAQEKESKKDTVKIKWGKSRIWIIKNTGTTSIDSGNSIKKSAKKDFTHWGGIDLGIPFLTTAKNSFAVPDDQDETPDSLAMNYFLDLNAAKSFFYSLNMIDVNFCLYKDHVHFTTGLGIEWNNYNFRKNITLDPDAASYINAANISITPNTPDSLKFLKNKLKLCYLKAPLLLELNTSSTDAKKSFHVAGGVEVAYKIGSRTKQVIEMNGAKIISKSRDDYHLSDIKYSVVVRAGYGDYFTVFLNYGLAGLFENNKGPAIFPFIAGISFHL